MAHLIADNILMLLRRHKGVMGLDRLGVRAAALPVVHGPGRGEGPSHEADMGIVVVEGLVDMAAAELEVHVLALGENHDEELEWEALQDRDASRRLGLNRLLLWLCDFFVCVSGTGWGPRG